MTYWGEPSSYLWMRMGRERGLPFPSMSRISVNNQSQEKISLTENAQKGSLVDCQEDVPYTALTIVCTINVSIDCDCFDVSNPSTRKNIHKRKSSQ